VTAAGGSLAAVTLAGARWTYLGTFVTAALQVAVTAVLARLLLPEAFGLVAMGMLVLRFGQYFATMGLTEAVVQRRDLCEEHVAAGFWAALGVGLVFWGLVAALAPVAAAAFATPALTPVLRALGAVFLLNGSGTTAVGLLRRALRFRALALAEIAAYAGGYAAVAVTLALAGAGAWSLVAGGLAQAGLLSLLCNLLARPLRRPPRRRQPYRDLLGFGSTVSLVGFLEFVNSSLDTIVVGRLAGTRDLGVYTRGLNLTAVPLYYLSTSLSKVLLPSLSRMQDDLARVGQAYASALLYAGLVVAPLAAGLSGAAREIVAVLLGPGWGDAVPIVRIAAVASCAALLSHFAGVALEATAFLRDKLLLRCAQLVLFGGLLVALSRFGLPGYAVAYALSELSLHVGVTWRARRRFAVGLGRLAASYVPGLAAAAAVVGLTAAESWALGRAGVTPFLVLPVQVASALLVWAAVVMRLAGRRVVALAEQVAADAAGPGAPSRRALCLLRRLSRLVGAT